MDITDFSPDHAELQTESLRVGESNTAKSPLVHYYDTRQTDQKGVMRKRVKPESLLAGGQ